LSRGAAFFGDQWGANGRYRTLRKPGFTPHNRIFPVVWPVLYAMIAIAGWLVWESGDARTPVALAFWAAQLGVNAI